MKRILFLLMAVLVVVLELAVPVHATLITRGTDTLGNRLIYDDDLNITWYDYSHAADTWGNQVAWADGLSVTFGTTIFDDWRLPTTVDGAPLVSPFDPSFYDGTGPNGYNITTSEMATSFTQSWGILGFLPPMERFHNRALV